jgi:hypothetical protein
LSPSCLRDAESAVTARQREVSNRGSVVRVPDGPPMIPGAPGAPSSPAPSVLGRRSTAIDPEASGPTSTPGEGGEARISEPCGGCTRYAHCDDEREAPSIRRLTAGHNSFDSRWGRHNRKRFRGLTVGPRRAGLRVSQRRGGLRAPFGGAHTVAGAFFRQRAPAGGAGAWTRSSGVPCCGLEES